MITLNYIKFNIEGETMPKVSFVMPVKNGEKFIENTIDSLQNQTIKDIEIVVINDHSEDDTLLILKKLQEEDSRIKIINLENNFGIGAGRNAGTEAATGEFILPVDADDPNFPKRAEISLRELEENSADLFYGNLERYYIETNDRILRHFQTFDAKMFQMINFIGHGASAFRKLVFEKVGKYDENLKIGEDYDFFLSALDAGFKFCSQNIPLAQYTMHPGQITTPDQEKIKQRQEWNKLIREKHHIYKIDPEYVKNNATPEIVDFYINKNYDIWFGENSIPKEK